MIFAYPKRLDTDAPGFIFFGIVAQEYFRDFCETLWKIRQQLNSNFAFVSARAEDARDGHPTVFFGINLQEFRA
jgi:hypothetical protein